MSDILFVLTAIFVLAAIGEKEHRDRFAALAILLFTAGAFIPAHADDQSFGACYDDNGAKATLYWQSTAELAEHRSAWGYASVDNYFGDHPRPFIVMDTRLRDNYDYHEFAQWVFSHECAHIKLGHVTKVPDANNDQRKQFEMDADVLGTRRYIELYGKHSLAIALDMIAATMNAKGDDHHPALQVRLDNIHHALSSDQ